MDYKQKKRIPRREDDIYKEIENFEDFEIINNTFYEMGIRTKKFKELEKKFEYCERLHNKTYESIIEQEDAKDNNEKNTPIIEQEATKDNNENNTTIIKQKSAKDNFEEALKRYEENPIEELNKEQQEIFKLDFSDFKNVIKNKLKIEDTDDEIEDLDFKHCNNNVLIEYFNWLYDFVLTIPKIIKEEFYIDFLVYYYKGDEEGKEKDDEYEESPSTSLYIKREYKESYYIETIIDDDNNKITRNLFPLSKRKLLTDHLLKFSSNPLMLNKQLIRFLEDFFKVSEVKIKKQIALADAFFCYDYYNFKVEEVDQENKKREKENSENIILQEAKDNIERINKDTYLSVHQKEKEKAQYSEVIRQEELKLLNIPTINKNSKHYIFKETKFKKSGITSGTAYNYYIWLKPYIDNNEYIKLINSEQPF